MSRSGRLRAFTSVAVVHRKFSVSPLGRTGRRPRRLEGDARHDVDVEAFTSLLVNLLNQLDSTLKQDDSAVSGGTAAEGRGRRFGEGEWLTVGITCGDDPGERFEYPGSGCVGILDASEVDGGLRP